MIDAFEEIAAIQREVAKRPGDSGETVAVVLRRSCAAAVDDVWDAVTDPERLRRWFLPISGDLRVGGTFQLEGNAGGEIRRCEPPRLLEVTFGSEVSLVRLRLTPDGDDRTELELEHTVPIEMAGSGAGALWVGPGWDLALFALGAYLRGVVVEDPAAAGNSPEARELSARSIEAWAAVIEASGTATADEIAAAVEAATAQFVPPLPAD
jgi:uncharacterized protein YndB with AHSA1/START domain